MPLLVRPANEPNPRALALVLGALDPHFVALLVLVLHFRAILPLFLV